MTPEQQLTLFRAITQTHGKVGYTHLGYTRTVFLANGWIDGDDHVTQAGHDALLAKLQRVRRKFGPWTKQEALKLLDKHWRE